MYIADGTVQISARDLTAKIAIPSKADRTSARLCAIGYHYRSVSDASSLSIRVLLSKSERQRCLRKRTPRWLSVLRTDSPFHVLKARSCSYLNLPSCSSRLWLFKSVTWLVEIDLLAIREPYLQSASATMASRTPLSIDFLIAITEIMPEDIPKARDMPITNQSASLGKHSTVSLPIREVQRRFKVYCKWLLLPIISYTNVVLPAFFSPKFKSYCLHRHSTLVKRNIRVTNGIHS